MRAHTQTHTDTRTLALLNNTARACLFLALINNLLSCLIYSEWRMELVESMDRVSVSRPYSGWPETRSQLLEPDAVEWRRRVQWPQCPKDPRLSNVSRWAPNSLFHASENFRGLLDCPIRCICIRYNLRRMLFRNQFEYWMMRRSYMCTTLHEKFAHRSSRTPGKKR